MVDSTQTSLPPPPANDATARRQENSQILKDFSRRLPPMEYRELPIDHIEAIQERYGSFGSTDFDIGVVEGPKSKVPLLLYGVFITPEVAQKYGQLFYEQALSSAEFDDSDSSSEADDGTHTQSDDGQFSADAFKPKEEVVVECPAFWITERLNEVFQDKEPEERKGWKKTEQLDAATRICREVLEDETLKPMWYFDYTQWVESRPEDPFRLEPFDPQKIYARIPEERLPTRVTDIISGRQLPATS